MKLSGFIIEQKNITYGKDSEIIEEWRSFSHKIYGTQEIAEHAYKQSPYRNTETFFNDEPHCSYSVAGRIVPVYRDDDNIININ